MSADDARRSEVEAFHRRWELRSLLIEGDSIAARFTDKGTHRGEFLGVPATGRSIVTQEFAIYHLELDRIDRVWVTADNLALLDQIR